MTTNRMGLEQESRMSDERIEQFIRQPMDNGLTRSEQMELARELLAYRGASKTPVAYTSQLNLDKMLTNEGYLPFMSKNRSIHAAPIALYTAPPIQAVTVKEGWIKCGDRMPESSDAVLVCQEGGIIFCAEFDGGEFYPDEFPNVPKEGRDITHWMPLPATP